MILFFVCFFFFFFKQKTAYEIVSGDWSSDVCSSDLSPARSAEKRASPPPASPPNWQPARRTPSAIILPASGLCGASTLPPQDRWRLAPWALPAPHRRVRASIRRTARGSTSRPSIASQAPRPAQKARRAGLTGVSIRKSELLASSVPAQGISPEVRELLSREQPQLASQPQPWERADAFSAKVQ